MFLTHIHTSLNDVIKYLDENRHIFKYFTHTSVYNVDSPFFENLLLSKPMKGGRGKYNLSQIYKDCMNDCVAPRLFENYNGITFAELKDVLEEYGFKFYDNFE